MQVESGKTRPERNHIVKKIWRPIAALAIVASVVYDEGNSVVNEESRFLSVENNIKIDELKDEKQVLISELIESRPKPTPVPTAKPQPSPDLNLNAHSLPSQPIINQEPIAQAQTLSRITGYYCEAITGYPIGDGGGWCGVTRSGETVRSGGAACGDIWQLKDKLLIDGYGVVECNDTGHLQPNQVDIFFQTNKDLAESGKPANAIVTKVS